MQIIEERELAEHKDKQITLSANPYQAKEKLRKLDRNIIVVTYLVLELL